MILQIATALAIGAYVVLSKDAQHKRHDATPRESLRLQDSADIVDTRTVYRDRILTLHVDCFENGSQERSYGR
jgi:hypothetical protein